MSKPKIVYLGLFHKLSKARREKLLSLSFGDKGGMTRLAQEGRSYHGFKKEKEHEIFPSSRVWAAQVEDEIVGWCLLADPYIYIPDSSSKEEELKRFLAEFNVYVAAPYRRHGLARRLYRKALAAIRKEKRTMEVCAHDSPSTRFYGRMSRKYGKRGVVIVRNTDF